MWIRVQRSKGKVAVSGRGHCLGVCLVNTLTCTVTKISMTAITSPDFLHRFLASSIHVFK